MFGEKLLIHGEWASKYPLFRMSADTAICSAHFLWPGDAGPARPFGALIHLKFMDDFAERAARNVSEGQHYDNSIKYRTIIDRLARKPRQIGIYAKSAKYAGPESLIAARSAVADRLGGRRRAKLCRVAAHWATSTTASGLAWECPLTIPAGERTEFEDFSRRAFSAHLTEIRCRGRLQPDEVGLICVLRNEATRLPLFFDHYKRLGVSRFFMIDNNSDDATRDLLLAEPRADMFHAACLVQRRPGRTLLGACDRPALWRRQLAHSAGCRRALRL